MNPSSMAAPGLALPQVFGELEKAGCQQQRELVPRLQHPLTHQQLLLPGAPKAAFQRVNTSCSCIRDICPNQQYTKGRLQWKRRRQILAKNIRSHVSHVRFSRQCQTVDVELERGDSDTFTGQLSAQPSAREKATSLTETQIQQKQAAVVRGILQA